MLEIYSKYTVPLRKEVFRLICIHYCLIVMYICPSLNLIQVHKQNVKFCKFVYCQVDMARHQHQNNFSSLGLEFNSQITFSSFKPYNKLAVHVLSGIKHSAIASCLYT